MAGYKQELQGIYRELGRRVSVYWLNVEACRDGACVIVVGVGVLFTSIQREFVCFKEALCTGRTKLIKVCFVRRVLLCIVV